MVVVVVVRWWWQDPTIRTTVDAFPDPTCVVTPLPAAYQEVLAERLKNQKSLVYSEIATLSGTRGKGGPPFGAL